MIINPKEITIDHFNTDYNTIEFKEPIEHQKEYVFENKGMPIFGQQSKYGKLIIKFNVIFPLKKLNDDESEKLLLCLKDLHLVDS
jgi:DnaJ-class molecular chaperone